MDLKRWLDDLCKHTSAVVIERPTTREECSSCRSELDRIATATNTYATIGLVFKELNLGIG